jgi:uncharacterized protein (DUF2336 family)
VRKALCQAPTLPQDILKTLGDDENEGVIEELFKREDFSEQDLDIFLESTNWRARAQVVKNTNVTEKQLLVLAGDEEKRVKIQMAKMQKLPDEVVLKLIFGETQGNNIRKLVLKKDLSVNVLIQLAKEGDTYVKKAISKRGDLPEEVITILSEDEDETVRSNLKAS